MCVKCIYRKDKNMLENVRKTQYSLEDNEKSSEQPWTIQKLEEKSMY